MLMTANTESETRYGFGSNWREYVKRHFSPVAAEEALSSVRRLVGDDSLNGRTFLDIGCGSGLFSLAAHRLGADSVVSFDLDPESVACCNSLRVREGEPGDWKVLQGSVLDPDFLRSLAPADVVYSWGVLHHTGEMWTAIANAAKCVKPGGLFVIGIYNHSEGRFGTETWKRLKRWHCEAPRWQSRLWERAYMAWKFLRMTAVGRNPIAYLRDYHQERGMAWSTDISDWLGGYPYEAATPGEVLDYVRGHFGFELVRQKVTAGLGVSEFVFKSPGGT